MLELLAVLVAVFPTEKSHDSRHYSNEQLALKSLADLFKTVHLEKNNPIEEKRLKTILVTKINAEKNLSTIHLKGHSTIVKLAEEVLLKEQKERLIANASSTQEQLRQELLSLISKTDITLFRNREVRKRVKCCIQQMKEQLLVKLITDNSWIERDPYQRFREPDPSYFYAEYQIIITYHLLRKTSLEKYRAPLSFYTLAGLEGEDYLMDELSDLSLKDFYKVLELLCKNNFFEPALNASNDLREIVTRQFIKGLSAHELLNKVMQTILDLETKENTKIEQDQFIYRPLTSKVAYACIRLKELPEAFLNKIFLEFILAKKSNLKAKL